MDREEREAKAKEMYEEMKGLVSDNREDWKSGKAITSNAFNRIQRAYDWFLRKPTIANLNSLFNEVRKLRVRMYMDANGVTFDQADREVPRE